MREKNEHMIDQFAYCIPTSQGSISHGIRTVWKENDGYFLDNAHCDSKQGRGAILITTPKITPISRLLAHDWFHVCVLNP